MVDGTGITAYTCQPSGALGATRLASVDGPLTNDTITYQYDELGRVVSRAINSVAATEAYDALARMTTETNVLGAFSYGYDGVTARLASVTYPNGQTSSYTYLGNVGDRRLQTIHHRKPDLSTLSKFDYTYDAVGNILTWQQQEDSAAPTVYQLAYDAADQITAATNQTTDPTPTILKRYVYAYDLAANRTTEQIDDAVTSTSYDALNRLTSQQSGGPLVFQGNVSKPATVTIQARPATVSPDNRFQGTATASAGTTTVAVTARDGSGNSTTNVYQVDQGAASKTFTYDANGNLTTDGPRTFEWDARNQLLAVTVGTHRSEFTYDGQQRRVRIVEKDNSTVVTDHQFIWDRDVIGERRTVTGSSGTTRNYRLGLDDNGVPRYTTYDHLNSVRDLTDSSGTVQARYEYAPFGAATKTVGTGSDLFEFTGVMMHTPSGLNLMERRAYDAQFGRWLSEDPIGTRGGLNLYAYVQNVPINAIDPTGLLPGDRSECTYYRFQCDQANNQCPPNPHAGYYCGAEQCCRISRIARPIDASDGV